MNVTVIGATGHIGSYLVPRLVSAGYDVTAMSRGRRDPYHDDGRWEAVTHVEVDREQAESDGTFGETVRETDPDAVIDLICYDPESAKRIVDALRGEISHFLHCGTIWIHGPPRVVPTTEAMPRSRRPLGEYGKNKAEIERYLLDEARRNGFPATAIHPGHIVGPGWLPLNPVGNFDSDVYRRLAAGEEVAIPNFGLETLHHVHADDVALAFELAMERWSDSVGEGFHVVSPRAITLRGYAEALAEWFGVEPNLSYMPWPEWVNRPEFDEGDIATSETHIKYSPNASIEKAREALGFEPKYTSMEAITESLSALIESGDLDIRPVEGSRSR